MTNRSEELTRRWLEEIWNQRKDALVDELMAEEAVEHAFGWDDLKGKAAFRKFRDGLFEAFPDLKITVQKMMSSGDDAVAHWRVDAKPKGSDESVTFWGITWFRWKDDLLVEGWDSWNEGGLANRLKSMGAAPPARQFG